MKPIAKIGIVIMAMFFFLTSCRKDNNAPIVPAIESLSFTISQDKTSALWIIGFTDGDGDIGIDKNNDNPDNEVIKLTLYGEKNGTFKSDSSYGYSIDYIKNINPNRPLEGKLEIDITGLDFIEFKYSAFYYEAVLKDRAGHVSNTIRSPTYHF